MTNQIMQLGVVGCGWAGCRAIEAANATSRLNVVAIRRTGIQPVVNKREMTMRCHIATLTIANSLKTLM